MERIDLNADVGESFGPYVIGNDERMFRHVTSANIACGSHGGDPSVMRRTVRLAVARGVSPGAHPGYADLMGFGRRDIAMDPQELEDLVVYQIGALAGMAAAEGTRLAHVKPHGALYNRAARDRPLADAIARAVRAVDPRLILFGGSGSCLVEAGDALGLQTAAEVFADRAYRPDGSLVPRREPGAVITDPAAVAERALRLVQSGQVVAVTGEVIELRRDTICLHGDTPGAGDLAAAVRARLEGAGVRLAAVGAEGRQGDGGTSPRPRQGDGASGLQAIRRQHPNAYEKWSGEEDGRLRQQHGQGRSVAELAVLFGRQPGAIRSRLTRLGLEPEAR